MNTALLPDLCCIIGPIIGAIATFCSSRMTSLWQKNQEAVSEILMEFYEKEKFLSKTSDMFESTFPNNYGDNGANELKCVCEVMSWLNSVAYRLQFIDRFNQRKLDRISLADYMFTFAERSLSFTTNKELIDDTDWYKQNDRSDLNFVHFIQILNPRPTWPHLMKWFCRHKNDKRFDDFMLR